jgi:hypothetical protein
MGIRLARLGEKERGSTMSRPTQPNDPGQEAHYRGGLKDIK